MMTWLDDIFFKYAAEETTWLDLFVYVPVYQSVEHQVKAIYFIFILQNRLVLQEKVFDFFYCCKKSLGIFLLSSV